MKRIPIDASSLISTAWMWLLLTCSAMSAMTSATVSPEDLTASKITEPKVVEAPDPATQFLVGVGLTTLSIATRKIRSRRQKS